MSAANDKIINLLTICRKSGRMTMGFDSAKESVMTGKAFLVILASDISAKSEKEIRFFSDKNNVKVIKTEILMGEIEQAIRKKAAIIAINDEGFAKSMTKLICSD